MTLDQYNALKGAAEVKQRAADRARGAYDAAMERLKDEWGCTTLKEARAKLKELQAQETELHTKLESKLTKFQAKWKHLL